MQTGLVTHGFGVEVRLQIAVESLNLKNLLSAAGAEPWAGTPEGTLIGHMHYYVGDLSRARVLYCEGLGMAETATLGESAAFVSAGGYHHHVGLNTWAGRSPVASLNDARMFEWTLTVPGAELPELQASLAQAGWQSAHGGWVDDWGIRLVVETF